MQTIVVCLSVPICVCHKICCRLVSVCLSVRLSVLTSRYCIETTGRIEPVFGIEAFFTYPALCYNEIRVSPKIRVLSSGTLPQTLDLKKFATTSQSRCQQNSSTIEPVDDTYTTVDESWTFLLDVGQL